MIGLSAQVNIQAEEATQDRLAVDTLAGDDVVDASGFSRKATFS
ncbi:MAG: hypothetical protein WD875_12590 [Pirellulales bacterium]